MTLTKEPIDFENFCRQIIGLTITKVDYLEIDYAPTKSKPHYQTQFANLDSVDFSIFLHTANDKLVEVYWVENFINME